MVLIGFHMGVSKSDDQKIIYKDLHTLQTLDKLGHPARDYFYGLS